MCSSNQPFSACVVHRPARRVGTIVEISIFGRSIHRAFYGDQQNAEAVAFVNEWNDLFDREWAAVRETSATIMKDFTTALKREGVDDITIDIALDEVKARATR